MTIRVLILLFAALAFRAPSTDGCRYSVRDVGFVDLGAAPYRLYVCLPAGSGDWGDVRSAIRGELIDSNVMGGVLLVDADSKAVQLAEGADKWLGDKAALAAVESWLSRQENSDLTLPVGLLVAPDDRFGGAVAAVHVAGGGGAADPADEPLISISAAIARAAATSPLREDLATRLLDAHSVVLLIEGHDAAQNKAARDLAEAAIERTAAGMKDLPKPIANPPQLVAISRDEAERETVLLWSLGVSADSADEPTAAHLVVLFGRTRLIGGPLTVPGATAGELRARLYFIGQDCECELDRSAMQGPMVPHVWDGQREAEAATLLGFDPGHPLVKVEMQSILARGPASGRQYLGLGLGGAGGIPADETGLLGYREIEIEPVEQGTGDRGQEALRAAASSPAAADSFQGSSNEDPEPDQAAPLPSVGSDPDSATTDAGVKTPESLPDGASAPTPSLPSQTLWWGIGAVAVVAVLLSGLVLLRSGRGN
jgi:hypothetical protein